VVFRGAGKKTVDVLQIKERFRTLGIEVDWTTVDKVISIRNDVEHYFPVQSSARLKELLADAFVIVRDFIAGQLNQEPVRVLGEQTWKTLLDVATVYRKELSECESAKEEVDWKPDRLRELVPYLRCSACQSELLRPVNPSETFLPAVEFRCSSCGEIALFEDIAEEAAAEAFAADAYIAMTDGGEPPLATCHNCSRETFLPEESVCFACGAALDYTECYVCHAPLGPEEQDFGGLCSYHHWVARKDD
jgi:hypothetical protein